MFEELKQANNAEMCWKICIKAPDGSRLQMMALKKYLYYCETVLQCLNIFRNFPIVRTEALAKILSFGSSFSKCFDVLREVGDNLELRMLLLNNALGYANTVKEYGKLRRYFGENSEGALICDRRISELSSALPTPEREVVCTS